MGNLGHIATSSIQIFDSMKKTNLSQERHDLSLSLVGATGQRNDSLSFSVEAVRTGGHEVDLSTESAEKVAADGIRDDLASQVDLNGRVDRCHFAVLTDNVDVVGVVAGGEICKKKSHLKARFCEISGSLTKPSSVSSSGFESALYRTLINLSRLWFRHWYLWPTPFQKHSVMRVIFIFEEFYERVW